MTLRMFLIEVVGYHPEVAYMLIRQRNVRVNGKIVTNPGYLVSGGDTVDDCEKEYTVTE